MIDSENLCRKAMEIYGSGCYGGSVVNLLMLSVSLEEVELVMMIL